MNIKLSLIKLTKYIPSKLTMQLYILLTIKVYHTIKHHTKKESRLYCPLSIQTIYFFYAILLQHPMQQ